MMRQIKKLFFLGMFLLLFACQSETDKYVETINFTVKDIDGNRRVEIKEDDFNKGDTIFKIRGYYMDDILLKVVGITKTPHFERDDYFYFDHNGHHLFTGHLINLRDEHDAAEYKYYYKDKKLVATMFWEDHYKPGKQFPHEHFEYFSPDLDSLEKAENQRLAYFTDKLDSEGEKIQEENENLGANAGK